MNTEEKKWGAIDDLWFPARAALKCRGGREGERQAGVVSGPPSLSQKAPLETRPTLDNKIMIHEIALASNNK